MAGFGKDYDDSSVGLEDDEVGSPSSVRSFGSPDKDLTSVQNDDDQLEAVQQDLAKKETKNVLRLRFILQGLLLATVVVSIAVYFVTTNAETDEFETQFEGAATTVAEAFENIAAQRIGAISSLAVAAIAHGVDHSRRWPFVTLSSFQQRASTARASSKALVVSIAPTVKESDRAEWETSYVGGEDSYWLEQGFAYQEKFGMNTLDKSTTFEGEYAETGIYHLGDNGNRLRVERDGPFLPYWETSPLIHRHFTNMDILSDAKLSNYTWDSLTSASVVFGGMIAAPRGGATNVTSNPTDTSYFATLLSYEAREEVVYQGDPMTYVFIPIFDSFEDNRQAVGIMTALLNWGSYFKEILPPHVDGVQVVLFNPCYGSYTYEINGFAVKPLGIGDLHDRKFNSWETTASFNETHSVADGTMDGLPLDQGECAYSIRIYPSRVFYETYKTSTPIFITLAVASVFFFIAVLFVTYDRIVERRQQVVMSKAVQSSALVSSLFPKNVHDRLLKANGDDMLVTQNHRIKTFLRGEHKLPNQPGGGIDKQEQIADLFPNCTVLFADIAGFTAWSSARDPPQVFTLLQAVYQAFDKLAKNRKVFKVETIGDSYVAATGLPERQEKHFLIMARFANECRVAMREIVGELEVSLGPGTGDLDMRFGLHSGPVTAGVLLGDRARFQLFGDTVNTAARMESTGVKGKIQLSQATAELIIGAGKEHWVIPRNEEVRAKGKGKMKTYWLCVRSDRKGKGTGSSSSQSNSTGARRVEVQANAAEKTQRLVDWMVELLSEHVKKLIAKNRRMDMQSEPMTFESPPGQTCLDEVVEAFKLPKFDAKSASYASDHLSIEIDGPVLDQLRDYVYTIACMYHANEFHCFEHACHVTQSVNKLLKRVVSPEISDEEMKRLQSGKRGSALALALHDYTYGITSDPLSSFAIVFSAMIHDADHRGVSNVQLMKEHPELATLYQHKSVAEQNSLDLSWDLFMSDQYEDLRACLFATKADLMRFRQVVVNVVLATDIFDKELNELRSLRWEKAFAETALMPNAQSTDLKATIVIEHIIQASDVAHTMQHWHVYRKWNEQLFREMYLAYNQGRLGANPAEFWYDGELAFFDKYILPLAKKLKECNVFGVSSDEYLAYATENREEWGHRGKAIVEEMVRDLQEVEE